METFVPKQPLVPNPAFREQRAKALLGLENAAIDMPMVDLIDGFARLPYCFTLQSCHGHFVYGDRTDPLSIDRLPISDRNDEVEYRIAYVALCVDNCDRGATFLRDLQSLALAETEYVQFGSATWFWHQQVNSYALQVEPERFKTRDKARVGYQEALHLQAVRDECFAKLGKILEHRLDLL